MDTITSAPHQRHDRIGLVARVPGAAHASLSLAPELLRKAAEYHEVEVEDLDGLLVALIVDPLSDSVVRLVAEEQR